MSIPPSLAKRLAELLGARPTNERPISGGDISRAARFVAGGRAFLVKWQTNPPTGLADWPDMFEAEARGLKRLSEAQTLRVPTVFAHADRQGESPAFLVLEWIESASHGDRNLIGALLGQGLAAQHRVTAAAYGLDHNNYCGATRQDNTWTSSWIAFYGERRLGFQWELAARAGLMHGERRRRTERLIGRLDRWIDEEAVQPSLLHGDLWGGNWLAAGTGEPVLIDPAVYYGDREAELAMCHLFGGFPRSFFEAYDAMWPPAPGRDERLPLYQLYHLLNHLNLFGEAYGAQVDAILRKYAG